MLMEMIKGKTDTTNPTIGERIANPVIGSHPHGDPKNECQIPSQSTFPETCVKTGGKRSLKCYEKKNGKDRSKQKWK